MGTKIRCDFNGSELMSIGKWYKETFEEFRDAYRPIHTRLSMAICVIGVFANIAIIVVLLQEHMRKTLINKILIAIACWDMLLMAVHLVYNNADICTPFYFTYFYTCFQVFYANFSVIAHTASLWLTVLMSAIRWRIIRSKTGSAWRRFETNSMAASVIVGTLIFVTWINIPNMLRNQILPIGMMPVSEEICGKVGNRTVFVYDIVAPQWWDCSWEKIHFLIAGTMFKIVPCVLLTVFAAILIDFLVEAGRRHHRLMTTNEGDSGRRLAAPSTIGNGGGGGGGGRGTSATASTDRTTALLALIVTVCLFTELPQGILVIAVVVRPSTQLLYNYMGDVLDLLSLINSSVNFILYCIMSQQFRRTFRSIFNRKRLTRNLPDVVMGSLAERRSPWTTTKTTKVPATSTMAAAAAVDTTGLATKTGLRRRPSLSSEPCLATPIDEEPIIDIPSIYHRPESMPLSKRSAPTNTLMMTNSRLIESRESIV